MRFVDVCTVFFFFYFSWRATASGEVLTIIFPVKYLLRGVIIQGHEGLDLWYTSFKMHYTTNGIDWTTSTDSGGTNAEVYPANDDATTKRLTYFRENIVATGIQIESTTTSGVMRFEILGFPFGK